MRGEASTPIHPHERRGSPPPVPWALPPAPVNTPPRLLPEGPPPPSTSAPSSRARATYGPSRGCRKPPQGKSTSRRRAASPSARPPRPSSVRRLPHPPPAAPERRRTPVLTRSRTRGPPSVSVPGHLISSTTTSTPPAPRRGAPLHQDPPPGAPRPVATNDRRGDGQPLAPEARRMMDAHVTGGGRTPSRRSAGCPNSTTPPGQGRQCKSQAQTGTKDRGDPVHQSSGWGPACLGIRHQRSRIRGQGANPPPAVCHLVAGRLPSGPRFTVPPITGSPGPFSTAVVDSPVSLDLVHSAPPSPPPPERPGSAPRVGPDEIPRPERPRPPASPPPPRPGSNGRCGAAGPPRPKGTGGLPLRPGLHRCFHRRIRAEDEEEPPRSRPPAEGPGR